MEDKKRTQTIKIRVFESEKRELNVLARKEHTDVSNYIRDMIFLDGEKRKEKVQDGSWDGNERIQKGKLILGHMCSLINQIKAKVETEYALSKLESEVEELWQLLR